MFSEDEEDPVISIQAQQRIELLVIAAQGNIDALFQVIRGPWLGFEHDTAVFDGFPYEERVICVLNTIRDKYILADDKIRALAFKILDLDDVYAVAGFEKYYAAQGLMLSSLEGNRGSFFAISMQDQRWKIARELVTSCYTRHGQGDWRPEKAKLQQLLLSGSVAEVQARVSFVNDSPISLEGATTVREKLVLDFRRAYKDLLAGQKSATISVENSVCLRSEYRVKRIKIERVSVTLEAQEYAPPPAPPPRTLILSQGVRGGRMLPPAPVDSPSDPRRAASRIPKA